MAIKFREEWLSELGKRVEPLFKGLDVKPYRVTVGWPLSGGARGARRVLGQCFCANYSKAGVYELFVSPTLDDPLEVAGVLTHEMTHVVAGVAAGHGRVFVKVARYVGLTEGKPTQALPGSALNDRLRKIVEKLGEYPHKAITPLVRETKKTKPPVKMNCECGSAVSMAVGMFQAYGPPTCSCGTVFVPVSKP